eukprot:3430287-Amphidinium_carterae.1
MRSPHKKSNLHSGCYELSQLFFELVALRSVLCGLSPPSSCRDKAPPSARVLTLQQCAAVDGHAVCTHATGTELASRDDTFKTAFGGQLCIHSASRRPQ